VTERKELRRIYDSMQDSGIRRSRIITIQCIKNHNLQQQYEQQDKAELNTWNVWERSRCKSYGGKKVEVTK
jgi:hypothetical protein